MSSTFRLPFAAGALLLYSLVAAPAYASGVALWTGATSTRWSDASNWTAQTGTPALPPGPNDTALFSGNPTRAATLDTSETVGALTLDATFSGSNATVTLAQALTVSGALSVSSGTLAVGASALSAGTTSISGTLSATAGPLTFTGGVTVNSGGVLTLGSGTSTFATGLTVNGQASGTGPVLFDGDVGGTPTAALSFGPATFAGSTTLAGLSGSFGTGLSVAGVTINSGSSLADAGKVLHCAGSWSNAGTFTATGTTDFDPANAGPFTIDPGGVAFNNLSFNASALADVLDVTSALVVNGALSLNAGTVNLLGDATLSGGGTIGDGSGHGALNVTAGGHTLALGSAALSTVFTVNDRFAYDLSSVSSGGTLSFATSASTTTTLTLASTGTLTLSGHDASNLLTLVSSTPGVAGVLNGPGSLTAFDVKVRDSDATGLSASPLVPTGTSFLGANTLGWTGAPPVAVTWIGGSASGATDWSVAANWANQFRPVTGSAVTFDASATTSATVNSPAYVLGPITLATGFTHTVSPSNSSFTCASLSIAAGTFDAAGFNVAVTGAASDLSLSGGTLTLATGTPTFSVGRNWSKTGGTFSAGFGSTVLLNGSNAVPTFLPGGVSFNNLKINKGTQVTVTAGGSVMAASLTVNSPSTLALGANSLTVPGATISGAVTATSGAMTFSGLVSVASGGWLTLGTGGATFNAGLTLSGTLDASASASAPSFSGGVTVPGGTMTLGSAGASFNGNLTVSGTLNAGSGPITFKGTGTVTVNSGQPIFGPSTFTGSTSTGSAVNFASVTINAGAKLSDLGKTVHCAGSWIDSGTLISSGTLDLDPSGPGPFTLQEPASIRALSLNASAASTAYNVTSDLVVGSTLDVTQGTLNLQGNATINGATTIGSGSTLATAASSKTLLFGSDVTLAGPGAFSVTGRGNTVEFAGGRSVTVGSSASFTIVGGGGPAANRTTVESTTSGTAWLLNPQGSATVDVRNVNLQDSNSSVAESTSNSIDRGGNTNWSFGSKTTTWISPSTGNWSSPSNWDSGLPSAGDSVAFAASGNGTQDLTGLTLSGLDTTGYTGKITLASDLAVTGALNVAAGSTITTGPFSLISSGPLATIAGRVDVSAPGGHLTLASTPLLGGTVSALGGGTLDLQSSIAAISGAGTLAVDDGTVNVSAANADFSSLSAMPFTTGTIAFTGSQAQTFTPKAALGALTVNKTSGTTLTLASGVFASSLALQSGTLRLGGQVLSTTGDVVLTDGTLDASPAGTASTLLCGGNWTAAGAGAFLDTADSSEVVFNGGATTAITTSGGFANPGFARVSITKTGSAQVVANDDLHLAGGLAIAGGTLDLATHAHSLFVQGDVTLAGGTLWAAPTSDLQFVGSGTYAFDPGSSATTTAGTLTLAGTSDVQVQSHALHVGGTTTIGPGAALAIQSTSGATFDGTVDVAAGGLLDLAANTTFASDVALQTGAPGGVLQELGATPITLAFGAGKLVDAKQGALIHVSTAGTQLVSSAPGTPWKIRFFDSSVESFGAVSVQDSNANPDAPAANVVGAAYTGTDLGGNTHWMFSPPVAPGITSASSTTFTVGSAGSFTVVTTGNPTPIVSLTGTLPTGVSFVDNGNGTGSLLGTPAAGTGGIYPLTVSAQNGVDPPASQSFTLTVGEAPSITSANTTTFTVATAGSFSVSTRGFPKPVLTEVGALPSGVTYVDNGDGTGTISGTPSTGTGGIYPITLRAQNGTGSNDLSFTLVVGEAPEISSAAGVSFTVGVAGTFTVTSAYAYPSPSFSESGALPPGVSFVDNGNGTATLSGTAAVGSGGTYAITLTAQNGVSPNGTQSFTFTVDEAPSITSVASASFTPGVAGSFTVTTSGFPKPVLSEQGTLPPGVTYVDNGDGTGTISGTPAAGSTGGYPVTLTATNGVGANATQSFDLTVSAGAADHLVITGLPSAQSAGASQSITVTAVDVFGQTATGFVGTVHFVSTDTGAGTVLPSDYAFTAADQGIHLFSSGVGLTTAGAQTVTARDTVTSSITGTSGTDTVGPAAAAQLAFAVQPGLSIVGVPISPSVQVTVEDRFGNLVTSDSTDVIAIALGTNPGTSTLGGALQATAANGVASFSDLTLDHAGTGYTLVASSGALTAATSAPFSVTDPPGELAFSAAVYPAIEGPGIATITVTRLDGSARTVTVDYATQDGTAMAGVDYSASSGTLTFATGERSKDFTVPLLDDRAFPDFRTVQLSLSNATGGATLGARSFATLELDQARQIDIVTTALAQGMVGSPFSQPIALEGVGTRFTWTVVSGALPPGLALVGNGRTIALEGTPVSAGTFDFTVQASDDELAGVTAQAALEVAVAAAGGGAPEIVDALGPPEGTVGTAYRWRVTATGGTPAYSWAVVQGALPAGLVLDPASGDIAGTPTTAGTSTFVLQVTDSASATDPTPNPGTLAEGSQFTLAVESAPLQLATLSLPAGTQGTAYSQSIGVSGGVGPGFTWTVSAGALPPGLTLGDSTRQVLLSGTPSTSGSYDFTVQVADPAQGSLATQRYLVWIDTPGAALAITTASLPTASAGRPYSTTLTAANGNPPYTWSLVSGTLPAGLSLDPATGILSGTPATAGTGSLELEVVDEHLASVEITLPLVVAAPPSVVTRTVPHAVRNTGYSTSLAATAGVTPYQWSIVGGTLAAGIWTGGGLPSGLGLSQSSGTLTGTSGDAAGSFGFTVQVQDVNGAIGTQALTLVLEDPPATLRVTTTTLPIGITGTAYSASLAAAGGVPGYTWSLGSGALPSWATLDGTTGVISGIPDAAGSATLAVQATDTLGAIGTSSTLTLLVEDPVVIDTTSLPALDPCQAYSATLAAHGGSGSYTWSIVEGSLPAGISLDATTGALTGTPHATGSFAITVRAADAGGVFANQGLTLVVGSSGSCQLGGADGGTGGNTPPHSGCGCGASDASAPFELLLLGLVIALARRRGARRSLRR